MYEQSKSSKRRFYDSSFQRYFSGDGIDIGCGPDPLAQYAYVFRGMTSCAGWDLSDGDAQYLETVKDNSLDFVHSSHCLEHMVVPEIALQTWIRVVKPGGYLIVTVPEEDMYEKGDWPSRRNSDHKHTFTMNKEESWSPVSINVLEFLTMYPKVSVERVLRVDDFFREDSDIHDQTMTPNAECCIEFILRKRP